ncbi:DUF4286 family protein [Bosea sp. BK604]|uniref:DUF4286 family protein n=1 Tax=Bosea sp. BK604 TaxID=2512180 RepID=UPI00104DFE7C|nr:DUF4286 family protein [Bosea sp. BK604]TCR63989.1 hypothetical protein EV560_10775 [Bosea sp. BK604]
MPQLGLLFVINEPPAAMEEELNAWYDTEHIPERLAIDGFLSGERYVSAVRQRRYLALYDLTDVEVLRSPGYMAFVGDRFTPWTKRILSRTRVTRYEAVQLYPGDAVAIPAPGHLILRCTGIAAPGEIEERAKRCFLGKPGVAQLRIYAGSGANAGSAFIHVAGTGDLAALADPQVLAGMQGRLELIETYLPY